MKKNSNEELDQIIYFKKENKELQRKLKKINQKYENDIQYLKNILLKINSLPFNPSKTLSCIM